VDRFLAGRETPVKVQLSVEIGVQFPVEVFDQHGPGFVQPGSLGLSEPLVHDLTAWLQWWQRHVNATGADVVGGDDSEWRSWKQEGDWLARRLQTELGSDFRVHFV
jgi:hypothetical protein